MIPIIDIIIIIWMHFIIDFIFQSRYVAENKSKNLNTLAYHSFIYSLPFFYFGLNFGIITGCLHFLVDLYTSKINSSVYERTKDPRKVLKIIAIDQAIHLTILILTYHYLFN